MSDHEKCTHLPWLYLMMIFCYDAQRESCVSEIPVLVLIFWKSNCWSNAYGEKIIKLLLKNAEKPLFVSCLSAQWFFGHAVLCVWWLDRNVLQLTQDACEEETLHMKRKHCLTIINNSNANIDRLYFILVWFVRVFFYRFYAQAWISSPSHVIQPFPPPALVFLCHLTAVAHKMRRNASGKNAKIRHSEKNWLCNWFS